MKIKQDEGIKILTYALLFIVVGIGVFLGSGEFGNTIPFNSSLTSESVDNLSQDAQAGISSIWYFLAGLIGFIAIITRKGI